MSGPNHHSNKLAVFAARGQSAVCVILKTNGVFTLPDTDTDTDTNKIWVGIELCGGVHTAPR